MPVVREDMLSLAGVWEASLDSQVSQA